MTFPRVIIWFNIYLLSNYPKVQVLYKGFLHVLPGFVCVSGGKGAIFKI